MKKILLALLITLSFTVMAFTQEETTQAVPAKVEKVKNSAFRIGGAIEYDAGIGDIRKYISSNLGMSFKVEFDVPFRLPANMRFGISARLQGGMNIVNNELLDGMWNAQAIPGIYFRFLLVNDNLILQPELGYGAQLNFPRANPAYNNTLNKMYDDQVIMFTFGIRYAPKQLMNGRFEIAVSPAYYLCPEMDTFVQYAGLNFGVMFRVL